MSKAYEVFLSYSSKDELIVRRLAAFLPSQGLKCWRAFNPKDHPAARDWADAIAEGLCQSVSVVLLFSSHAAASPYVKEEIAMPVNERIPELVVQLERIKPALGLRYRLAELQFLVAAGRDRPFAKWSVEVVQRVREAVPQQREA